MLYLWNNSVECGRELFIRINTQMLSNVKPQRAEQAERFNFSEFVEAEELRWLLPREQLGPDSPESCLRRPLLPARAGEGCL